MRRLTGILVAAMAASVVAGPAGAAERGEIRGRVINQTTGRPQAGVTVTLTAGDRDAQRTRERSVVTGRDGRYVFTGLQTGDDRYYALDAVYRGGLFAGRPLTLPAGTSEPPVIQSTLRVWETTNEPGALLVRRDVMFLVPSEGGVTVIESVTLVNPSDLAYIGRGADPESSGTDIDTPSVGFPLPPGTDRSSVQIFESDLDLPRLVDSDFGFGITSAIPPGETRITYTFTTAGTGGVTDLTRRALYDTSELIVLAAEPLTIDSNRLTDTGETETIEGRTYRRWEARRLDPADPVQISVIAAAGNAPLLIAGGAAALVLAVAVALIAWRRARRPVRTAAPAPERLAEEIAALDVRHEAGEITDETWRTRRAELKRRLAGAREGHR